MSNIICEMRAARDKSEEDKRVRMKCIYDKYGYPPSIEVCIEDFKLTLRVCLRLAAIHAEEDIVTLELFDHHVYICETGANVRLTEVVRSWCAKIGIYPECSDIQDEFERSCKGFLKPVILGLFPPESVRDDKRFLRIKF